MAEFGRNRSSSGIPTPRHRSSSTFSVADDISPTSGTPTTSGPKETCAVNVVARFRPLNDFERETAAADGGPPFECRPDGSVEDKRRGQVYRRFDTLFDMNATQRAVYESSAKDMVNEVLEGYNAGMFAYGQSGGGKTYSMLGKEGDLIGDMRGIVPRAMSDLFYHAKRMTAESCGQVEVQTCISFFEIYKDELYDLLNQDANGNNVKLGGRENRHLATLKEYPVSNDKEANQVVMIGQERRRYAFMPLNPVSSRSHGVLMLKVKKRYQDTSVAQSALYFVDLMGSEALVQTSAGSFDETTTINLDLLTLGKVITLLGKKSKTVAAPYRDSTLTWVLRDVLGGNCKATVLITCSPHQMQYTATQNTLEFGDQCKGIQRRIAQVEKKMNVKELENMLTQLRQELQLKSLEQQTSAPSDATKEVIEQLERARHDLETEMKANEEAAVLAQVLHEEAIRKLERRIHDAENGKAKAESKLSSQILTLSALSAEVDGLRESVKEAQGEEVLDGIRSKLMATLSDSQLSAVENSSKNADAGGLEAMVEQLVTEREESALKLQHTESMLSQAKGDLQTKVQVIHAVKDKLTRNKDANERAAQRATSQLEQAMQRSSFLEEQVAELKSQLEIEQAQSRADRDHMGAVLRAAEHDAEDAEDALLCLSPRSLSARQAQDLEGLDEETPSEAPEAASLSDVLKRMKDRLNKERSEVVALREREGELESLLALEVDKNSVLEQENASVKEREMSTLNAKIQVDAELLETKKESEVAELQMSQVVAALDQQVLDTQANLGQLRDEMLELKQDKLVSDRSKVRANKQRAHQKFAAAAFNLGVVQDNSPSSTSTSISPKQSAAGEEGLNRTESGLRRLPDAFVTGKRQLAHHARQASQGSIGDELSP